MTKWIWGLCAVVAIVVLVIIQRGGTKTAYVNGLPEYTSLPGREYILEHDCYVFKLRNQSTNFPLIGANAPDLPVSVPALPKDVSDSNIGLKNEQLRILDVVRVGTRFKIISVRRDQSKEKTTISFEILLLTDEERKYPRLDAFYLLDHAPEKTGAAPTVIEGYAVQRVKL